MFPSQPLETLVPPVLCGRMEGCTQLCRCKGTNISGPGARLFNRYYCPKHGLFLMPQDSLKEFSNSTAPVYIRRSVPTVSMPAQSTPLPTPLSLVPTYTDCDVATTMSIHLFNRSGHPIIPIPGAFCNVPACRDKHTTMAYHKPSRAIQCPGCKKITSMRGPLPCNSAGCNKNAIKLVSFRGGHYFQCEECFHANPAAPKRVTNASAIATPAVESLVRPPNNTDLGLASVASILQSQGIAPVLAPAVASAVNVSPSKARKTPLHGLCEDIFPSRRCDVERCSLFAKHDPKIPGLTSGGYVRSFHTPLCCFHFQAWSRYARRYDKNNYVVWRTRQAASQVNSHT